MFRDGIESITGKAELSVFGGENGFSESVLEKVEATPGVKTAVPMIESRVYYLSKKTQRTETLVVLGIDLLKESSVRVYQTEGETLLDDPLVLLNQPESVILTKSFANENEVEMDGKVRLATSGGERDFTVRGLLSPSGPAKAFGGGIAIMDIDAARLIFGKENKLDRIDIVPAEGVKAAELRALLEKNLGPTLKIETPETQTASSEKLVEGYQGLLSFLGVLALAVGLFLVSNSMSISIAERRRDFGALRAIGASTSVLMLMVMCEAVLLGAAGSVLGVGLGRAVASFIVDLVSRALATQYLIPVNVKELALSTDHWIRGVGLGTGFSLLASSFSFWRVSRIQPVEAVKQALGTSLPASRWSTLGVRALGVALLLFVMLDTKLALSDRSVFFKYFNPFSLIFGAALASPFLVYWIMRLIRRLSSSTLLRLSCDNLLRTPERTGSNVMSLMVGLILVIIISTLNGSIKGSVVSWMDRTLASDLIVSSNGRLMSYQVQPLDEKLQSKIDAIPGVDIAEGIGAMPLRYIKQEYEGRVLAVKAYGPSHPRIRALQFDVRDRPVAMAVDEFYSATDPVVFVSENFVKHFDKKTGDRVSLMTPRGSVDFRVIGVVREFTNPEGVFVMNRATYQKYWDDRLVTAFMVMAKTGVSAPDLKKNIEAELGKSMGIVATMNSEFRPLARQLIDESFTYTKAIEWAALLVGLFGLLNTLMVSVMERTREIGMLRATGMSRFQLGMMIFNEGLLQGSLGGLVAVVIGCYVSYFWVIGTVSNLMGIILDYQLPVFAVLQTVLSGIVVGCIAGWIPSRFAAKQPIRELLGSD